VQGTTSAGSAEFTLEWPQPVTVAEVVYYGRTAFQMEECWHDYQVFLDDAAQPAASGQFKMTPGPQRIKVGPTQARRLRLKFLSSYNGSNPGASEIQVFAESPSDKALAAFFRSQGGAAPIEESEELARLVADEKLGFDRLLLIKRRTLNPSHVYTRHCEGFSPGGGLYVLAPPKPEGTLTELVASPKGQIMDLDLSVDGREVLFSWRAGPEVGYHVFRINVDGTDLVQLTDGPWHDYNACWLPDGGIAFISSRSLRCALCWTTASGVLHRMDRDGGNVRQLSANYVDDFSPAVLPDGRILFSRWEYVDRPAIPIQSLWAIHPDGTQLRVFYGNRVLSPASFLDARPVPGTAKVLCTLAAHNGPIRGGMGIVDNTQGLNAQESLRNLTPEVNIGKVETGDGNFVRGPYEQPNPIDERRLLVSRDGALLLWDTEAGCAMLYASSDGLGCYDGTPVAARPRPPVLGQVEAKDEDLATVYLVDVYRGLELHVARGRVKAIRVVEEVAKRLRTPVLGFGFQRPVISCGAAYAVKKVWGTARVEEDGSAYFRVPTGRPLYFIAVDDRGVAVQRMRSFTQFARGEMQGCIGCHEPRGTTPPAAQRALALRREPQDLEPPSWGVTGFDYARHVQPVIDRHCAKCHSGLDPQGGVDLSADKTDWFNVSYDVLTRRYVNWIDTRNGQEANILQVTPLAWGSPKSKLTEILLSGHPDKDGKARVGLDAEGLTRILTWIDLNVPYYGTYEMGDGRREGGRRVVPADLDKTLADVSARRCASCHKNGMPMLGYVRITNPEANPFLTAPLAKAAGGREACKAEVFRSREDPDYQAILKAFDAATASLKEKPRMDMDGAAADSGPDRTTM
ncbi:MAG: hypothetical protein IMZ66_00290, partial [Planctomycetes bacterium]|nr:hypothetical protein [Planctomycetota bacterium]